ncbi:MAG: holo-ACP synthase [Chloroflexi bacterium]|nr:holo-ACP synthase [Chloroflexota bacterium]
MRYRVGVDVVAIDRVEKTLERFGQRFLQRVFTPEEISYCASGERQAERLAARFAAKEAASKALGKGIGTITWQEIEVRSLSNGQPELLFYGRAAAEAARAGFDGWSVSLSHDRHANIALAFVLCWSGAQPPIIGQG